MNPGNPYRNALLAISVSVTILSLVILMFGAILRASSAIDQIAAGAFAAIIAAALLQLSGICFLLWLVVSAIGWRAGDTPKQTPASFSRDWAKGDDEA